MKALLLLIGIAGLFYWAKSKGEELLRYRQDHFNNQPGFMNPFPIIKHRREKTGKKWWQ